MQLMTSTTTSAKVPPGGGKAKAGKQPITKKQILILCYIAAGIALVIGIYFIWKKTRPQMPRMDDPTPKIVHYTMTSDFEKLPFDMQAQFMKLLETRNEKDKGDKDHPPDPNKGRELDKAFEARQISETEYRAALQLAWFGKHLNRIDRYFSNAGPQRVAYLDHLILSKIAEDEQEKIHPKPPKENDINGNPSALEEKARIDKWPTEAKDRWDQFERDYSARKKKVEEARAKTRPTVSR